MREAECAGYTGLEIGHHLIYLFTPDLEQLATGRVLEGSGLCSQHGAYLHHDSAMGSGN